MIFKHIYNTKKKFVTQKLSFYCFVCYKLKKKKIKKKVVFLCYKGICVTNIRLCVMNLILCVITVIPKKTRKTDLFGYVFPVKIPLFLGVKMG